jgi:predicted Zn-ribbon and HTH transcriptional regulator
MNNAETMSAAYLLERAEQCRRLARQALSHDIANELERLACDYDKDAAALEMVGPNCRNVGTVALST